MATPITELGYVLRRTQLPSEDVVIRVLTQSHGMIPFIAKRVRSAKSKRSAHLQTGNLIKLSYIEREQLSVLAQTTLVSGFSDIRSQINKVQCMYAILILLDRLLPAYEPETRVFAILHQAMIQLTRTERPVPLLHSVLSEMIYELGYTPESDKVDVVRYSEELIDEKLPVHDIIGDG